MTTVPLRLLNKSWIQSSSVFLLRQRSSECGDEGSEATAPALGRREFDLLRWARRRRGVHHSLRPPQPRCLLCSIPSSPPSSRGSQQATQHQPKRRPEKVHLERYRQLRAACSWPSRGGQPSKEEAHPSP